MKTRKEVAAESKAAAEAEEPAPLEDGVIDDSLAEMGVDPTTGKTDASPGDEVDEAEAAEEAAGQKVATTENPKASAKKKKTVKKKKSQAR